MGCFMNWSVKSSLNGGRKAHQQPRRSSPEEGPCDPAQGQERVSEQTASYISSCSLGGVILLERQQSSFLVFRVSGKWCVYFLPGLYSFILYHGENNNGESLYDDWLQQMGVLFEVMFSSSVIQQLDSFAWTELAP